MNEDAVGKASARVDRALARIEAAVRSRDTQVAHLQRRHAILRERIGEAIVALDQEIVEAATDG